MEFFIILFSLQISMTCIYKILVQSKSKR